MLIIVFLGEEKNKKKQTETETETENELNIFLQKAFLISA